jgi:hypothetical protein
VNPNYRDRVQRTTPSEPACDVLLTIDWPRGERLVGTSKQFIGHPLVRVQVWAWDPDVRYARGPGPSQLFRIIDRRILRKTAMGAGNMPGLESVERSGPRA